MSGITYSPDKPKDCRYCYYWKNSKAGCTLGVEKCYYRVLPKKAVSECDGCPYGKYGSENGECYEEYKKDKLAKLEKAMPQPPKGEENE